MSYIYSRALVAAYSEANCLDTDVFAPLSENHTPKLSWWHDKTMEPSRHSRFGMKYSPLTESHGADLLTWFAADSLAKTLAQPEAEQESTANDPDYGAKWPASSVRYDPATSSWKTAHCLWDEDLPWSSVILPKWGMTRNGHVFRHPTRERPISGIASGLWQTIVADDSADRKSGKWNSRGEPKLSAQVMNPQYWPTPTVCGNHNRKGLSASSGDGLATIVKQRTWPTATATATATASKGWSKNHNRASTDDRLDYTVERENFQPGQQTPPMRLNPDWVELLMGWPKGYTDLEPLQKEEFDAWFKGFSGQGLRDMRQDVQSAGDAKWPHARCEAVSCAETLQPRMRQQQEGVEATKLSVAYQETSEGCVRIMRLHEASGCPSLRSGSDKQRSNELANAVQPLPRLLARYGQEAWQNGSWENAVPRVTTGTPYRSNRLKAIGNGQVSRVAAAAFAMLHGE